MDYLAWSGQLFLYFTAGMVWGVVGRGIYMFIKSKRSKRNSEKLDDLIASLKKHAADIRNSSSKISANPEIHTFQWHHDGKMHEVKIVIDPNLDAVIPGTREEFENLVREGEAGSLETLMHSITKPEHKQKLGEVQEFYFSKKSVEQMKLAGMSPDELVVKMLKAAGRM